MAAARDVDIVSGVVRCVCVPGRRRRDILFDGHVNRSFLVEAITICKFVSEQINCRWRICSARFVCGVTPYLPNSHRTSIGIQSFRPKPAPFSSSSTSGYSFRHTLNARTRRPASSRTRAREPRDAMRSSRRNAGAPRRATLHPPKVLASLAVLMAACMGGAAADLRRGLRRAAAQLARIQGGARGDRAPEHDRPARGVDDSVRGRSRAHGPAARDVARGRDAGIDDARADALRRVSRVGAEVREAPGVLPRRIRSVRRVPQARGGVEDKRAAHRGTQQALGYVPTTHPSTTDTQPHEPNRT